MTEMPKTKNWILETATVLAKHNIPTTLVEPKDKPIEDRLCYKQPSTEMTLITTRLSKNPKARIAIWPTITSKLAVLKIETEQSQTWLHEHNYQLDTNQCLNPGNYPKFHLFNPPPKGNKKVLDFGHGLTIFTRGAIIELPEPEDVELWLQSLEALQIRKSKASQLPIIVESNTASSKKGLSLVLPDDKIEKAIPPIPSDDEVEKALSLVPPDEEVAPFSNEAGKDDIVYEDSSKEHPDSINEIITTINNTYVKHGLSMVREIGAYVFKVCYNDDMDAYSYKRKKPVSLRALAKRQNDLYVSYSTIQRAVALYHQSKILGALAEDLTPAQHRALFSLDNEKQKKQIAKNAIEHKWTEAQVRDSVAKLRVDTPPTGRPKKPELFRALTRAENVLSSGNDPLENLEKYLEKLKDTDVEKLYSKLDEYVNHFNKAKAAIRRKLKKKT